MQLYLRLLGLTYLPELAGLSRIAVSGGKMMIRQQLCQIRDLQRGYQHGLSDVYPVSSVHLRKYQKELLLSPVSLPQAQSFHLLKQDVHSLEHQI